MGAAATAGGPSISRLFTHIHYVRLVVVEEDARSSSSPYPMASGWTSATRDGLRRSRRRGRPMTDEEAGPLTWSVSMRKT